MAAIAGSHRLFCTNNNLISAKGKREHVSYDALTPPIRRNIWKGETGSTLFVSTTEPPVFLEKQKGVRCPSISNGTQKQKHCLITKALRSEKHLNSLNSYLGKLHDDIKKRPSKSLNDKTKSFGDVDELKAENGLRSLESYLDKAKDVQSEKYIDKDIRSSISTSGTKDQGSGRERLLKNYMELKPENSESKEISDDEVSDFYLIGALESINIAVFLFEIATPVKSSYLELVSLPMVYGAKINDLILTGEWWRLVTPMFLHWGILHIAIGSWALFTFGLQVSREYGAFNFLLIYVLGGISENLISFLHTAEPTVGGTGPVFAIIGAWLIYQVQNKDIIAKNAYEKMFRSAIITAALICILSNFSPIDDWAHFGAAFTGIAYGFATCPTVQLKDASLQAGRQERITLVHQFADPCKSLIYFSLFILLLSCLPLIIEPPVELI